MAKNKKSVSQKPQAKKSGEELKAPPAAAALVYATVFTCGMSVMALEIAASRLYAPYFGASLFVWVGLIGMLLIFLAAGNYIGGRMSRAGAGSKRLFPLVIAASALGGLAPFTAMPVMALLSKSAIPGAGMLPGIIITSTIALAPPLVILGCVLPLSTGILTREARDAGRVAGTLYAISTAGSVIGVFLPALVTLPYLGTRETFLIFAAVPGIAAAAGAISSRALLLLLLFFPYIYLAHALPIRHPMPGDKLLAEAETPYNYVQMVESKGAISMDVDRGWAALSSYRPGEQRTGTYRDYFPIAKLLNSNSAFPRSILILGVAGGTDARIFRTAFPGARITGVEIDPALIALGKKYMQLNGALDRIVIADGRSFLRSDTEKYDLIIVDVYNQEYIPFHMATVEFFEIVRRKLAPGGVAAMNVAWRTSDEWNLPRVCAETLSRVFPTVYMQMFSRPVNTLLFATAEKIAPETVELHKFTEANTYVISLIRDGGFTLQPYPESGGEVFTDDKAPVEQYTLATVRQLYPIYLNLIAN